MEEEYLISIISPLITGEIRIDKTIDNRGVLLEVYLNSYDLSVIVGKKGQNVAAIKHLMHIYGSINKKLISLKVNIDENRLPTDSK